MQTEPALTRFINTVKKRTIYSRKTIPNNKVFSASMAGSELLEQYFIIKHGVPKDASNIFSASDLGSVFHLGMEEVFKDEDDYFTEKRFQHKLDNSDWTISAQIDLIDTKNKIIFDYKLSTTTAKDKILKQGKLHPYALQLAINLWLLSKTYGEERTSKYKPCIAFFDKKGSLFNSESEEIFYPIFIDVMTLEETQEYLTEATTTLDKYIDNNKEPKQCKSSSLFWYKKPNQDKATPMKCEHFCSYKNICKHFSVKGSLLKTMGAQTYNKRKKEKK